MEVYSSHFSYREPLEGVDDGCKYDGRYMRINVNECHENNNSQMECPAMADSETSSDSRTGKLAGFLMLFYCSQSLSTSKLF